MARFAENALIRRIDGEGVLLLGGGRALLMQLAHPAVAAGVARHSNFHDDPLERLFGTLEATYTIVFGTDDEVTRMTTDVRGMHGRVRGDGYDAHDPALLCWVNATLVDTAVRIYETTMGQLSEAEKDEYVHDSRHVAEVLGCPLEDQPADWASFRAYVDHMVATLTVSAEARSVADALLHPTALPIVTRPGTALNRLITAGTLPVPLREQYGLGWSDRQERLLRAIVGGRRAYRFAPPGIRHLPKGVFLRRARRRGRVPTVTDPAQRR